MKYKIKITKSVWIFDVKSININTEQGWTFDKMDDWHSECIKVQKVIEIEFGSDYAAISYANNLKDITCLNIICEWMESSVSTLTFDPKKNAWIIKTGKSTHIYNN